MSIWSSVSAEEIHVLNGDDDAVNYRAEGEPTITVDVATTGHHDHIRLVLCDGCPDVAALLAPDAARARRDQLTQALGGSENR
ncbi:hypothetical protein ACIQVO_09500 [Streptomyces sp. NPDC101062]|uniref:hypothetical protein n=1 Tax=unclassified Streptomyces TaxID=2593676 RepID=UPI00380CD8E3